MNKKKRLEQLTQGALKASSKTVDDIWRVQNSERYVKYCCTNIAVPVIGGAALHYHVSITSHFVSNDQKSH